MPENSFYRLACLFTLDTVPAETEMETESIAGYTQELRNGAESVWTTVFSSKFFYALILLVIMYALFKAVDLAVKPLRKRYSSPFIGFMAGIIKAVIAIVVIIRIMNLFSLLNGIASQILMSSSLLVVVAGFVFQEGLSNIVHGFILSASKPFQIGDRVTVTIDGNVLTGYVRTMGLRATSIQNVENNAIVSVPNSKLDLALIQNNYTDPEKSSTGFLDLSVTYESDLEKAINVTRECIASDSAVRAESERTGDRQPPMVTVRSFGDSGIDIRGIVKTRTVEENFAACSRIRRSLKKAFDSEDGLDFAYPHVQLVCEDDSQAGRNTPARE